MRQSWRSWFWNIVLLLVMVLMGALGTTVSLDNAEEGNWAVAALFGVIAAAMWVGAARALMIGVWAGPDKVISRGFTSTTTVAWSDVVAIVDDASTSGPSGAVGATAPAIVRRRPGKADDIVVLDGLGGYGINPRRPTLSQRAVAGLNEHLNAWRRSHPSTDLE